MLKPNPDLDRAFHALADGTRRALLDRLSNGPASVSELAAPFPSSLAAIVQHVQVLEKSGLVVTEKIGRTRTCRLAEAPFAQIENWLSARRMQWEERFDRLGTLVEHPLSDEKHR